MNPAIFTIKLQKIQLSLKHANTELKHLLKLQDQVWALVAKELDEDLNHLEAHLGDALSRVGSLTREICPEKDVTMGPRWEFRIRPLRVSAGGGFVAYIPAFGESACSAQGGTEEEALKQLRKVLADTVLFYIESGKDLPPSDVER